MLPTCETNSFVLRINRLVHRRKTRGFQKKKVQKKLVSVSQSSEFYKNTATKVKSSVLRLLGLK